MINKDSSFNDMMSCFFHRRHRVERLAKCNAPSAIMKKEQEMDREILSWIKNKYDFDADRFIQTDKGKAEFLLFCEYDEQIEKNIDRCNICRHMTFIDAEPFADKKCSIHGEHTACRVVCHDNEPTEYDNSMDRMQASDERCADCENFCSYEIKVMEMDIVQEKCAIGADRYANPCPHKKIK